MFFEWNVPERAPKKLTNVAPGVGRDSAGLGELITEYKVMARVDCSSESPTCTE